MRSSPVSDRGHFPQLLPPEDQVSSKTRNLMQEVSRTEIQVKAKRPPVYGLRIVADQNEKPLKIEIEVELPGSRSVCLCDVTVSEGGYRSRSLRSTGCI